MGSHVHPLMCMARAWHGQALRRQLFDLLEMRIAGAPAASVGAVDGDAWDGRESADARREARGAPPSAAAKAKAAARALKGPVPGTPSWPPPMESKEQAQEAILASLVYLIGKGMELQGQASSTVELH